jgi:hypothetical protein
MRPGRSGHDTASQRRIRLKIVCGPSQAKCIPTRFDRRYSDGIARVQRDSEHVCTDRQKCVANLFICGVIAYGTLLTTEN